MTVRELIALLSEQNLDAGIAMLDADTLWLLKPAAPIAHKGMVVLRSKSYVDMVLNESQDELEL